MLFGTVGGGASKEIDWLTRHYCLRRPTNRGTILTP
jgi:hypothetical protein